MSFIYVLWSGIRNFFGDYPKKIQVHVSNLYFTNVDKSVQPVDNPKQVINLSVRRAKRYQFLILLGIYLSFDSLGHIGEGITNVYNGKQS